MARAKEREEALQVDQGNDEVQAPPPIAATFLVKFDNRKGYTIAWQRSVPDLNLDGVVDYKSLPSGLHTIKEDLVYFTHDQYAGISAFVNEPAPESHRNADMLSVGVLVPLDGRLGKSWLHAESLKELAKEQISDIDNTDRLEQYWKRYTLEGLSPKAVLTPASNQQILQKNHPALSLPDYVKSFGPLVFLLYRAALLRKRILIVGDTPVEENCNFVYDLSLLSTVPNNLIPLLPVDGIPDLRLRPLFNVSVQDMSLLSENNKPDALPDEFDPGWVACTTDDVLASKPELFDILVILPPFHANHAVVKQFPKIVESTPELSKNFPRVGLKATQRDARRYRTLRAGLREIPPSIKVQSSENLAEDNEDSHSFLSQTPSDGKPPVEPIPWSLVAYTSFIWWASAGEKRSGPLEEEEAEEEQDQSLLAANQETMNAEQHHQLPQEIALVSYFHRLTSLIFTTISDAISRQDGEAVRRDQPQFPGEYHDVEEDELGNGDLLASKADAGDRPATATTQEEDTVSLIPDEAVVDESTIIDDEPVEITQEDMTAMGLDIWSASDRNFVEELIKIWWGRAASVSGGRIECCGVRLL